MAGDWIKMTKDLPDKPEVWRMAGVLNLDADSVVGKLLRVWAWFDSHTENGNAVGVTYPLLDRIAGVTGFAEAMALCGWLEKDGHIMSLPKFDRHNGKTAKNRALTNERVGKSREKQREVQRESNADSVTKTVSREEKRREERNTDPVVADAPTAPPLRAKDLEAEGVDSQTAADWLALRKAKRLPLTVTAWDDTKAEGRKAGLTPPQTVAKAVANNWAGFKASWLKDGGRAPVGSDVFAGAE